MTHSRTVEVVFQGGDGDDTLLARLIDATDGAARGGAIFAWASRGAEALLRDDSFVRLATEGTFDLIVGTDSITDTAALAALVRAEDEMPNLRVWAFVNDERPLFHPKLAWFEGPDGMRILVGSGNLTTGGLQSNWEAFTDATLDDDDALRFVAGLRTWVERMGEGLRPLSDPAVRRRVEENTGRERDVRRARPAPDSEAEALAPTTAVLVAELPQNRSGQADFPRRLIEGYFGLSVAQDERIVLVAIAPDGSVLDRSSRRATSTASSNHRIELEGVTWPPTPWRAGTRPIVAFVRVEPGVFVYASAAPAEPGYEALLRMAERGDGTVRRVETDVDALRAAWPDSPLWQVDLGDVTA